MLCESHVSGCPRCTVHAAVRSQGAGCEMATLWMSRAHASIPQPRACWSPPWCCGVPKALCRYPDSARDPAILQTTNPHHTHALVRTLLTCTHACAQADVAATPAATAASTAAAAAPAPAAPAAPAAVPVPVVSAAPPVYPAYPGYPPASAAPAAYPGYPAGYPSYPYPGGYYGYGY